MLPLQLQQPPVDVRRAATNCATLGEVEQAKLILHCTSYRTGYVGFQNRERDLHVKKRGTTDSDSSNPQGVLLLFVLPVVEVDPRYPAVIANAGRAVLVRHSSRFPASTLIVRRPRSNP